MEVWIVRIEDARTHTLKHNMHKLSEPDNSADRHVLRSYSACRDCRLSTTKVPFSSVDNVQCGVAYLMKSNMIKIKFVAQKAMRSE